MVADLRQSILTYKVQLVTIMYIHAVYTQLLTSLTGTKVINLKPPIISI